MITLHHLENSRSQRILWLLEELGVDYEIKRYSRDSVSGLGPPELRQIHPLGKSPIVSDGEEVFAESGAIIEYLVEQYGDGNLRPRRESPAGKKYTYWLHYAEGTFMPLMIISLILRRIESASMPFFAKPIAKGIVKKVREGYLGQNTIRNLDFMESVLSESEWFCGPAMTAADIQMSFVLEAAEVRTDLAMDYPYLSAFLDRIRALPNYQTALSKGGPFQLGG